MERIFLRIGLIALCVLGIGRGSWAQVTDLKASLAPKGDPILKKRSLPVSSEYFSTVEMRQFTEVLGREMFSHFRILGIAAPQMSVSLRVFLIRSSLFNPFNKSYEVFINPVVTPIGDATESGIEFCLSARGLYRVRRYKRVQVEFSKIDGTKDVVELSGSRARIAQHELDHLDGKLITDEKRP